MAQSALMRMGRPPSIQSSRSPTQSVRAPGGGGLAVWRQDSTGAIAACTLLLARFRRRKAGSVDWPALGSELSFQTLLPPPPAGGEDKGGQAQRGTAPEAQRHQRGKDAPHRQRCRPDRARRTLA